MDFRLGPHERFGIFIFDEGIDVLLDLVDRSKTTRRSATGLAGASALRELTQRLAQAPRRRDFKTVPMILTSTDQWDHQALSEVIA